MLNSCVGACGKRIDVESNGVSMYIHCECGIGMQCDMYSAYPEELCDDCDMAYKDISWFGTSDEYYY